MTLGLPRVAIVVLNYNGLDDTLACLRSLQAVDWRELRVFLVDNASAIDPGDRAREVYSDLDYLRTSRNLGYAGGNNRGIERALDWGADYVLVLNNDTVVAPEIVATLVGVFDRHASLGIIGPVVNFMDEPAVVMTDGAAFDPGPGTEFFPRIVVPVVPDNPPVIPVDIVNGCCIMFRAGVLRSVGLFDESLFIVHEESDLCLRALRQGSGCAVVGRTLVWHKGSSAFERSGRQLQRYYDARNLFHLVRRHAGHVPGARGFWATFVHCWLYAFYRYAVEIEAGKPAAAVSVVRGARDGAWDVKGPLSTSVPADLFVLQFAFRAAVWLSGFKRGLAG